MSEYGGSTPIKYFETALDEIAKGIVELNRESPRNQDRIDYWRKIEVQLRDKLSQESKA